MQQTLILALTAAALAVPTARGSDLAGEIERFLGKDLYTGARIGIHVVARGSGRVIYAREATQLLIPASNQKLVTALAGLRLLGEDYEFVTRLCADGPVRGGALQGDLILRGGGDPTIGGRYDEQTAREVFQDWGRQIRERGIHRVAGDLVADDSFFDRQWYHPNWSVPQAWKWYFAPVSAISINDNCVTLTVRPGAQPGEPARLSAAPVEAAFGLVNACETASSRHAIWFDRSAHETDITVGGYVRQGTAGYSHRVTVPVPALYAAEALKAALEGCGIRVDGSARMVRPGETQRYLWADTLCERRTPLLPVLRQMVKRSHNHYAEQVVKTVGAERAGEGSWKAGLACAAALLRSMGFRRNEFQLDDGSGLSRGNRLSPALLTTLLLHAERQPETRQFASLLAVPGESGTLRSRLREAPYGDGVRAKTGYLNGVGALSGYATTRSGTRVAFSILINDDHNPVGTYSMSRTADALCRLIVDHAE